MNIKVGTVSFVALLSTQRKENEKCWERGYHKWPLCKILHFHLPGWIEGVYKKFQTGFLAPGLDIVISQA
jgi:hypothetical protein